MNKKKIALISIFILSSFILIISFTNILNKKHFSVTIDDDIVDYSLDEKKNVVVKTDDKKIEYQIIQSDFDTVNQVRVYSNEKDRFVDAYDKYIEEYKTKLEGLSQLDEDYSYYSTLIANFEKQKEVVRREYNEKIVDRIDDSNASLSNNWKKLDEDNTIQTDDNKDNIVVIKNSDNKYDIHYNIKSKELMSISPCEISEQYLIYSSLPEEEQNEIEVVPALCARSMVSAETRNYESSEPSSLMASGLPSRYSLVEQKLDTPVKNQMSMGYCTVFGATAILEDYMLIKTGKVYDFSEEFAAYKMTINFKNNKKNIIGTNENPGQAFYFSGMARYYGLNYGPVLEKTMPYSNKADLIDISKINRAPVVNVNDIYVNETIDKGACSNDVILTIKKYIYTKSPVEVSITTNDKYFNYSTGSLYFDGSDKNVHEDHSVTLVGWDDNYSKDNFGTKKPKSNGAFLIKNSWGTSSSFGTNGYFWVSYEDYYVCHDLMAIEDADTNFSDNQYVYDFGKDTGYAPGVYYGASKFYLKNSSEKLTKVKFATAGSAKVEAFLIADGSKELKLSNSTKIGERTVSTGGFYTINLTSPKTLTSSSYYIIVKFTPNITDGESAFLQFQDNLSYFKSSVLFESRDGNTFSDCRDSGSYPLIVAYTETLSPVYSINYNGNGGKYNGENTWLDPRKFKYGSVYPKAIEGTPLIYSNKNFFVRNGYIFKEWNTKANGSGYGGWEPGYLAYNPQTWRWKNGEYGIANYRLELYAQWEPITYKILYHGNGGTFNESDTWLDKRNFVFNQKYPNYSSEPIIWDNKDFFIRKGYIFKEWNTKANGSGYNGWPVNYSGSGDYLWKWYDGQYGIGFYTAHQLDLYAQWEPIHYTFKFDANGGTGSMSNLPRTFDVKVNLPKNTFTRTGYVFDGWNSKADGTGNLKLLDGQEVGNETTQNGKEITLYAQWRKTDEVQNYSITYNLNNADSNPQNPTTYTNQTNTFTLINPTYTCNVFTGWTGTGLSTLTQSVTIPKGSSGDRAYTANFTPAIYNITYSLNGGTGGNATKFSQTTSGFAGSAEKPGYVFLGWTSNQSYVSPTEPVKDLYINTNDFGCRDVSLVANFKKDITKTKVTLDYDYYKYTGSEIKPVVEVIRPQFGDEPSETLELDRDYTVSYYRNINSGIGNIRITGINNYTGVKNVEFPIQATNVQFYDGKKMILHNDKVYIRLRDNYSIKKSEFVKNFISTNVTVLDKNGYVISDDDELITNGYKVEVDNVKYQIIFLGDIDSSGYINIIDLNLIYREIKKQKRLGQLERLVADYNMDETVDNEDLTFIYNIITGKSEVEYE
ncbi:MAG: InlB B-repeat-containing protein [Bacilli bacterium]|nr:InlB B-repeat-containing protein [Bacilli bacterium]